MKMCHMENILHVLKFHFGEVWAPGDNVDIFSTWRQLFGRGSFFKIFIENFDSQKKNDFSIFKILEFLRNLMLLKRFNFSNIF